MTAICLTLTGSDSSLPSEWSDWEMLEEPRKPKGKLTQEYLDDLYRYHVRLMAIDLLRQKYQLTLDECQRVAPEVVQRRAAQYHEHLARLRATWEKEDNERNS